MRLPLSPAVVILGVMGGSPYAGVAWQTLHYLLGFRRLGYDAWYVEATGTWPYDPRRGAVTADPAHAVEHLARLMARFGLAGRWAYRAVHAGGECYGLSPRQLDDLFARAEAVINLTGSTPVRDEYRCCGRLIYLETDPVAPQVELAAGRQATADFLGAHHLHFTFAENLGAPDCGVPATDLRYRPTRQPVVLDLWGTAGQPGDRFTTVANWQQSGREVVLDGETYFWSKDREFLKFLDLPRRTSQRFELALVIRDPAARAALERNGWIVADALEKSADPETYRRYIQASRGEFTVAKDQNVRLRSGWFSDRSACYLAAGRPVITQDTGFGRIIPTGRGLFAFQSLEDILAAVEAVNTDYALHAAAARELAAEYFDAAKVLARLAAEAGLPAAKLTS